MIADAMDGDGKLTAPQVSRKIKQLGLYIPRKKRSGDNLLTRDEDLNDSNKNNANDSDDETLLSLMNRLFMFLSECQSLLFFAIRFYLTTTSFSSFSFFHVWACTIVVKVFERSYECSLSQLLINAVHVMR